MTRLFNDPAAFADEALEGFVAAHPRRVRQVPGGVVRATRTTPGQVAVVVGGGSGHYPAFSGLVGQGLAHGAAVGNVFASPSAHQVRQVAKAAQTGGGVLLAYGNYAGDVLHFGQAAEQLAAEGIPARTLGVTDDMSSASPAEAHKRRGVAGDLVVFKAAAAAAEAGHDLAEVTRIAELANARTRSFGVAFSGCTLPGAGHPLFTVPEGRMAVGLGIHGEPGMGEQSVPTADGAAELLVETVLGELPEGVDSPYGQRAAVILNGLGSVKYEELFVVYRRVAQLLAEAGVQAVDPEVGELVTSFDMAGVSLTLCWLTDELEPLWTAPADTPAYRKGVVEAADLVTVDVEEQTADDTVPDATDESRAAARTVLAALRTLKDTVDTHADELGRIDAVAGDGDHGIGMQRGATGAYEAAVRAAESGAGAGTLLLRAADAWADRAGGTSGALWGVILRAIGTALGDTGRPTAPVVAAGVAQASEGVMRLGGAEVGDKTMVDVLVPFAAALTTATGAGRPLPAAWDTAASTARAAAAATAGLLPRMGRARPHAEKSLGTPDAGAHSLALIVRAVHPVLATTLEKH
ncbi:MULTISPECIES: dihydroxyacetone kinase family protein [unclassified Streptomyces]|uniref:dihydroxyacetone kinase family protein n=1 Tax=unclassified Streptomyces TaxID=2593676 RepID=UPI002257246B|nr:MULTISPECIES: dihydroxyacetone kinase family protein [unclassified Streptomyces]WSP55695.1 dihydroxyacetone kinase family protein [Streptomyces sp. NBC_01241]WSU23568.1 dihydroxyacetone kinase family protein [Streptomyces sp. NBC_01108]MCX4796821.1 dihydroxyacetone kinase family protein [Streptomyces sp. NBC_01242]WSJ38037.1 dihydroxyacetone kinase family protein [Streptomyces sp. NBC_01321]WSP64438.1 dihydroxyacetone kinase family protein [Streptomyces sp. NBC_01240]